MSEGAVRETTKPPTRTGGRAVIWLALGAGTGLVMAAAMATAYRWRHWEDDVDADPRAEKVHELIQEAERLLAQGRNNN